VEGHWAEEKDLVVSGVGGLGRSPDVHQMLALSESAGSRSDFHASTLHGQQKQFNVSG
jgi:hypothetical protein